MASFGTIAVTNPTLGIQQVVYGAIAAGYTPNQALGETGILAAVMGSFLQDSLPAKALTVGSGTQMTKFTVYSVSLVPVTVASAAIEETSFTVTGITTADKIFVNHVSLGAAISNCAAPCSWRVVTANVIFGAFLNMSAATSGRGQDGTYKIVAIAS